MMVTYITAPCVTPSLCPRMKMTTTSMAKSPILRHFRRRTKAKNETSVAYGQRWSVPNARVPAQPCIDHRCCSPQGPEVSMTEQRSEQPSDKSLQFSVSAEEAE